MRLGFWQQSRAHEKIALQASIQAQGTLPSLDGAELMRAVSTSQQGAKPSVLHRTATLTGNWLPQHTLLLDNRQMNGKAGFFVLTPFVFADRASDAKKTVLVQRGWLPRNFLDRNALPEVTTDSAEVTITGRIALSPSKLYEFEGVDLGVLRQNVEIEALAREFKLEFLPYSLLQLDAVNEKANAVQDKILRQWTQPNNGTEKNYGYMVQWWALSALIIILYVWCQLIQPILKTKHKTNNN